MNGNEGSSQSVVYTHFLLLSKYWPRCCYRSNFAGVVQVPNSLTLSKGEYPGGPNLVSGSPIKEGLGIPWTRFLTAAGSTIVLTSLPDYLQTVTYLVSIGFQHASENSFLTVFG